MPPGCATHWPPVMNWYSVFVAEGVAHAAVPAGQADAGRDRLAAAPSHCSPVIWPMVQIGTIRLSDCILTASL